jgi:uncharacterized membrane protein YphA (DoxX/SURF4 family)
MHLYYFLIHKNMDNIQTTQTVKSVWTVLKFTYGIVPIVAGLDKFTDVLVTWENYLNPSIAAMLPFSPHAFMLIVGVIEIIAGIIVFIKPLIGGYVVMAWLILIALTLLAGGIYLDIAVRDIVMSIGAMSLARLSKIISG